LGTLSGLAILSTLRVARLGSAFRPTQIQCDLTPLKFDDLSRVVCGMP